MAVLKPTEAALKVLKACTVEGNIVKLPAEQLARDLYVEVRKHLELIGGKWKGGKTQGFVFENSDPEYIKNLLQQQADGDGRNLKKDYQFFATPMSLAKDMVNKLFPFMIEDAENPKVLEPSAGDGALVRAAVNYHPSLTIDCFETMEVNRTKLGKVKGANLIGTDFLQAVEENNPNIIGQYDYIIANPPFSKNQDIDHIRAMYRCLKTNGTMATIASMSWVIGSQKKQVEFQEWLQSIGAYQEEIPRETFKDSGTQVGSMLLIIDRLEEAEKPKGPVYPIPTPNIVYGTPDLSISKTTNSSKANNMRKIVVQTAPFHGVLKKVKEVIVENPAHPLLDNILVKVRRKDMQIIATDLMVTLIGEVEITNDFDHGYEFLLPFKFLLDTVNLINDSNITIELQEKEKKEKGKKVFDLNAVITTFSDVYNLDFLDSTQDWPKLPEFPRENSVGIADGFIEWLNLMCKTAVPEKDTTRPAMQKIFISIANNGITMASTNANVLVEKTFQCESASTADLLIHPKIAKALKGFKETSISWSDKHMAFVSANMTIIGTLQDEIYPNYKSVFPVNAPNLKVTLAELTGIMDKCCLTGKDADIWLKREIGHVVFESIDRDYNRKITVRAGADYSGDCTRVAVIPAEFLKLLGQISYVSLNLSITSEDRPIVITTESDSTYRALIMPQTTSQQ